MTDDRGESQRPSGPRPEGRWCSIELSCDRGQLHLVPHHRGRLTIHPSCMPRLTLADHLSRQTDRHESFDHARQIAARRCSTSASMCGSRTMQREQRCGDGEGRECSASRTRDGRGALTSTLGTLERCQRPISASAADLLLVLDAPSARAEGTVVLNVIVTHTRSRNTCNVKSVGSRST